MTIWTITGGQAEGYYIHLTINSAPVKMELDTGAAVSVMYDQQWKQMFGETVALELYKGKPLQGYSGYEVQVIGQAKVEVEYGNQRYQLYHCLLWQELRDLHFSVVIGCRAFTWTGQHCINSEKMLRA